MTLSRLCLLFWIAVLTLGISCSIKGSIIGKWLEINGTEAIEFSRDGTASFVDKGVLLTGKYRFVEDTRIELELSGNIPWTSPQTVEVALTKGELTLVQQQGKTSRYRRAN